MTLLNLAEIRDKIAVKDAAGNEGIAYAIRRQLEQGYLDLYETSYLNAWRMLGKEDQANLKETLNAISLPELFLANEDSHYHGPIKEFLASSGTTGIAGAYYLIPLRLWNELYTSAYNADITAQISRQLLGPSPDVPDKIDVAKDGQYKAKPFSSGSFQPAETMDTVQCTFNYQTGFGINIRIANDLIEDANWDTLALHVSEAGKACGDYASNAALTILGTAPDGDGTLNTCTSATANTSKFYDATGVEDDVGDGIDKVLQDKFVPNTFVTTWHGMKHNILGTMGQAYHESTVYDSWLKGGWPTQIAGLNVVYSNCDYLTTNAAYTTCKSVVFQKEYGIVTARKRWLRIEKYSEPVRDLSGATITCRQDSVSIFKDAICTYTEV